MHCLLIDLTLLVGSLCLCCCFLQIRTALPTSKVFRFSKSTGKLTILLSEEEAGGGVGAAEEGEGGGGGDPGGEDTEEDQTQATQA